MKITIKLKDPALVEQLDNWKRSRLDDFTPAMQQIGRFTKTQIQLGFSASSSPYGTPWAPLKLRSGQPLRDTGRLMNSINFRVRDARMAIGTNVSYAKTHQFGATIRPVNAPALMFTVNGVFYRLQKAVIPARPFLPTDGLPPAWQPHYESAIIRHLTG